MPTHRSKIGDCYKCAAELCHQTNGADYDGPSYWVGGDPDCLHCVEGCEFDEDEREPYSFPELNPQNLTIESAACAAGFRRGIT